MRVYTRCRVLELGLLAACLPVHSTQLPLRRYTTADGLANNTVLSIAPDSRGFLWFGTAEGLSRFDGFGFTNRTQNAGLPHGAIEQILIGRHGDYWLATNEGLIRFRPDLPPSSERTVVVRSDGKPGAAAISVLLEARGGTLWCGTDAGLYTVENPAGREPRLAEARIGLPGVSGGDSEVTALAEDAEGGIWIGTNNNILYRRLPDQTIARYVLPA